MIEYPWEKQKGMKWFQKKQKIDCNIHNKTWMIILMYL